jgi:hypothetical protein
VVRWITRSLTTLLLLDVCIIIFAYSFISCPAISLGAIAFALALNIPGENRPVLLTAALSVIIFTTIFCGGLTEKLVAKMGLKRDPMMASFDARSGAIGIQSNGIPESVSMDIPTESGLRYTHTWLTLLTSLFRLMPCCHDVRCSL